MTHLSDDHDDLGIDEARLSPALPWRHHPGSNEPSPVLQDLVARPASPVLRGLLDEAVSPATREAYEADWRRFAVWCAVRGLDDPLATTGLDVAEYIARLAAEGLSYSTISRRVAAIGWAIERVTGQRPTRDGVVLAALAGVRRRQAGRPVSQAAPLRLDSLRRILTGSPILEPNRPALRRDQAMIGIGWAGALRSGELVALDVDDVTVVGDPNDGNGGVLLSVQAKGGDREWVAVPFATQWAWCPARILIRYLRNRRGGPLFRHIDRHGHEHRRLAATAVSDAVRHALASCLQLDTAGYSSHSLRAGFVTEARANGAPDELIARHTRHTTPGRRGAGMLNVYDRPTDLFERTPFQGWW